MSISHDRSRTLFRAAEALIPGGVNSPVRAFKSVGGDPLFIERGEGAYLFDVDGNRYLDYVMSWGPLIFGHAHPRIVAAIVGAAGRGTSFGACTEGEVRLAGMIVDAVPGIERVRLVNSGTEAVMSAVRVARGFTKRDKVVKFEGCYHGHSDQFLSKSGSGLATFDLPDSAGVPASVTQDMLTVPYNDIDSVSEVFAAFPDQIACVVVEPVAGNMGVVSPRTGFLEGLREISTENGALLLFDEVITGFRLSYGGAQELYGVVPDLTTLGKIVGGGLPLAAYGGRADIMDVVAPVGPVYQAGTLSGNPLAVAAGITQLEMLKEEGPALYSRLDSNGAQLVNTAIESASAYSIPIRANRIGSLFTLFFTDSDVCDYASARRSDTRRYARFFQSLLEQGVYVAPSQFEAILLSAAHGDEEIAVTVLAVASAMARL